MTFKDVLKTLPNDIRIGVVTTGDDIRILDNNYADMFRGDPMYNNLDVKAMIPATDWDALQRNDHKSILWIYVKERKRKNNEQIQ